MVIGICSDDPYRFGRLVSKVILGFALKTRGMGNRSGSLKNAENSTKDTCAKVNGVNGLLSQWAMEEFSVAVSLLQRNKLVIVWSPIERKMATYDGSDVANDGACFRSSLHTGIGQSILAWKACLYWKTFLFQDENKQAPKQFQCISLRTKHNICQK